MPKVVIHYQDRWAVVTGASSGLGRGLAAGFADRGMSLVLTGRNEARLDETAHQIRRAAPAVKIETVAADLSSRPGVSALLDHVGDRPVEVLVNNAGFGSYGPFAEADPDRETEELAVDVGTVVALARAFLPGMLARGSGGILNVASTIAFQPAPLQAVYGANKAFVLSFSQALWAEARPAGVAVTALCPGPTRTGFVDALGADVGHTAIYRRLADPGPVIKAGLGALDQGRAVVIPGLRNKVIATGGRFLPREWLTRFSGAAPPGQHGPPPADRRSQPDRGARRGRTRVGSAGRRRRLAVVVSRLPVGPGRVSGRFRWKAHPVALRSTVVASDRPDSFTFIADARGLHAEHAFTLRPAPDGLGTVVLSHETQTGPLPWLGRVVLGPLLHTTTQAWLADLARAVTPSPVAREREAVGDAHRI